MRPERNLDFPSTEQLQPVVKHMRAASYVVGLVWEAMSEQGQVGTWEG